MPRSLQPSTSPEPGRPVILVLAGPVVRSEIPEMCSRAAAILADVEPGCQLICDVQHIGTPDSVTLDALARLQLTTRRMGHELRLRNASPALRRLLGRAGMRHVMLTMPSPDTSTNSSEG